MNFIKKINIFTVFSLFFVAQSCTTLESTVDSTWESISEAGDFIYDSVNFWEDEEPEQNEAIVIEEAVEVPEFALPDDDYFENEIQSDPYQQNIQPQKFVPQQQTFYDPIYRSQRQYYFVGPNGTPMLAPPPPPFPQYSIDQAPQLPYSYSNNLGIPQNRLLPQPNSNNQMQRNMQPPVVTLEEEMELYGIQNDCVRVAQDFVNGGFMCDDYD
jgi:hypothetical protein